MSDFGEVRIEHATFEHAVPMGEPGKVDDGLSLPIVKAPAAHGEGGPSGRKRSKQVLLWLTPEEKERLRELASDAGTSVSRYLLDSTVYADAVRCVPTKGELQQVMAELRRQGNNANQMARAINAGRLEVSDGTARAVADELAGLRVTWLEILKTWTVVMAELDGVLP